MATADMIARDDAPRLNAPAAPSAERVAPIAPPASEPVPPDAESFDRDHLVLAELARESESRVAFAGLRRRLDVHQQSLARSLRRLERDGLVSRDEKGYRLTERGLGALSGKRITTFRREPITVVQALLPPTVDAETVGEHLSHRWFRGLRWYGESEGPGETTFSWLTEPDRATVRVRVSAGAMTLEVEAPRGDASRAFGAARGVLAALAELYGVSGDGRVGAELLGVDATGVAA